MGYNLIGITYDQKRVDYTNALIQAELSLNRFDSPGKLTFSGVESSGIAMPEGTSVQFLLDGTVLFQGFVFTVSRDRYGETSYVAYDQLRYLKAKQSYTFTNQSLEQIITQICGDFKLTTGSLAATGYAFPSLIKEDDACIDILFEALSETIYRTGKIFNLFDDAGKITLKEAKDMIQTVIVGDRSMMTDYTYKRDIDAATYNRVKLVRPNKDTGKTDVYMYEDTDTQKQWGLLQYYEKVDENLNAAQIEQLCQAYLKYYNRVTQSLTIDAVGIPGIRPGMMLPVLIGAVDTLKVQRILLVEKVTHTFEGGAHTMNLEVKNFEQLGGAENGTY